MADVNLNIKVAGDKEAQKSLDNIAKSAAQAEENISEIGSSGKKSLGILSSAAGAVGGAFQSFSDQVFSLKGLLAAAAAGFTVHKLVDAAQEQENAINRLNSSLALNGEYSKEASLEIQEFAEHIEKNSKVSGEAALDLFSLASSFGLSTEQAKLATQAAIDYSAATGKDATSAIQSFAQTLNGSAGAFAKTNAAVQNLTVAQLSNGDAIALIAKQYEGFARSTLTTFSGATTQAGNAFNSLQKELGFLITTNPAVIASIGAFTDLMQDLSKLVSENRKEIGQYVSKGLNLLIDGVEFAIRSTYLLVDAFNAVRLGLNKGIESFSSFFSFVLRGWADQTRAFEQFAGLFRIDPLTALKAAFTKLTEVALRTISTIISSFGELFSIFGENTISQAIDAASRSVANLSGEAQKANSEIIKGNEKAANSYMTLSGSFSTAADTLGDIAVASKQTGSELYNSINGVNPAVTKLADNFRTNVTSGIQAVVNKQEEASQTLQRASDERVSQGKIVNKKLLDDEERRAKEAESIEIKLAKRRTELNNQIIELANKSASDPINALVNGTERLKQSLTSKELRTFKVELEQASLANLSGAVAGIAQDITKGGEGAKNLLVQGASAAVNTLIPGLGSAIAPIFQAFASGPEAAKKMVREFLGSIPQLITNIIQAAPAFLIELIRGIPSFIKSLLSQIPIIINYIIDSIPEIISAVVSLIPDVISAIISSIPSIVTSLINALPRLITSLIESMPLLIQRLVQDTPKIIGSLVEQAPQIVVGLIRSITTSLPSTFLNLGVNIIKGLLSALGSIPNLFLKLFGFDGGGKGAVESFLGFDFPFIKFAKGGVVPGRATVAGDSARNDKVPALLSPGEIVLPRSVVELGAEGIAAFVSIVGKQKFKSQAVSDKDAVPVFQELSSLGIDVPGFGFFDDVFGGVVDFITSIPEKVYEGVTGTLTTAFETVVDVGKAISEGRITDVFKAIQSGAIKIFTQLGGAVLPPPLDEIFKTLVSLGANIKVEDLLTNPIKAITNAVKGIVDIFKEQFRKIFSSEKIDKGDKPSTNGSLSDAAKGLIPGLPKFATGGMIPSGYENDNFVAGLSSGEFIVNNTLTPKLENFLNSQQSQPTNDRSQVLLEAIVGLLSRPVTVESSVQLNQDTFADIILTLNRTNRRLA